MAGGGQGELWQLLKLRFPWQSKQQIISGARSPGPNETCMNCKDSAEQLRFVFHLPVPPNTKGQWFHWTHLVPCTSLAPFQTQSFETDQTERTGSHLDLNTSGTTCQSIWKGSIYLQGPQLLPGWFYRRFGTRAWIVQEIRLITLDVTKETAAEQVHCATINENNQFLSTVSEKPINATI